MLASKAWDNQKILINSFMKCVDRKVFDELNKQLALTYWFPRVENDYIC